jgi:GNAT superfamily N-acetyltransferase
MRSLKLTRPADFGVLFDTARLSYSDEGWKRASHGIVTREVFIATCKRMGFPSIGFECNGVPIGGMMFDGTATHIGVLPQYQGRWAFLWEEACEWMFALKDPFIVRVEIDNKKCQRFVERNGWKPIAIDNSHVAYEISSKNRLWRRRATHAPPADDAPM